MIRNLFIKNSIPKEHLNQNILRKFTKNLKPVLKKIKKEIYLPNKTLNILNEKFKINFNVKDLKRFKKFQTIALIGMGGSILGTEALHNSLFDKIKKKIYFFDNLDEKNPTNKIIMFSQGIDEVGDVVSDFKFE